MARPPMMHVCVGLLLRNVRLYSRHRGRKNPISQLVRAVARSNHFVLSVITASDIQLGAWIGQRVSMPHPCGIVIHRDATVGDGCIIMQQVTLGLAGMDGVPQVGANVYIGAGAKVLGPIRVGDQARIGANAVVLIDVPPFATAVGVPAQIVHRRSDTPSTRAARLEPDPTDPRIDSLATAPGPPVELEFPGG